MRGTVLLSLAAVVVLAGAVSSAFVQRTLVTPAAATRHAADLSNRLETGISASNQEHAPEPVIADAEPANPVIPDAPAQRLLPTTFIAPRSPAIVRKVLSAQRNLLALQTLPKHVFTRIAIPELADMDAGTIAGSVIETPKVISRVQPIFAPGQHRRQAFTLSFSLDAAGIPQQINLARGQASEKQLLAAQTALAKWRFEPKASAKFIGNRFEQAFTFREVKSEQCLPKVGTRICR